MFKYLSQFKVQFLPYSGGKPPKLNPVPNSPGLKSQHLTQSGVVIVEYVLLLVACLAIAILIAEVVEFGDDSQQSGWLIQAWMKVLETIAEDM